MVLPNLAYIGGGAEVAYWMQLKTAFEAEKFLFQSWFLRPSALLIRPNQLKKLNQLDLSPVDLFQSEDRPFTKSYVLKQRELDIENESAALIQLFEGLKQRFNSTAQRPIIEAEYQRQSKALEKLHKKLIKIEKQNHQTALRRANSKVNFSQMETCGERYDSFIPYFLNHGDNFMKILKEELNPLDSNFVVLSL